MMCAMLRYGMRAVRLLASEKPCPDCVRAGLCVSQQRMQAAGMRVFLCKRLTREHVIMASAVPQRSPSMPFGDGLKVGALIEFRSGSELLLGVIEGMKKQKWVVYDKEVQRHLIRPSDVTLVLPGKEYSRRDVRLFSDLAKNAKSDTIQSAWKLCASLPEPIDLERMAKLLYGTATPSIIYNAYSVLKMQTDYFRQVGVDPPLYYRKSSSEASASKALTAKRQLVQESQSKQLADFKLFTCSILEDPNQRGLEPWMGTPHEERIRALKQFAIGKGPNLFIRNLSVESLRALNHGLTPNSAATLMEDLGIIPFYAPLPLLRSEIDVEFTKEVEAKAQVYTVDSPDTRAVDDGVSIERLDNSQSKIWVHVADPSRWLQFGDEVDLDGLKRAATIHLPTGEVPCFPPVLCYDVFSLKTGQKCCALSFGAVLNPDGEIVEYEVVNSTIVPSIAMTFSEAHKAINEGEGDIAELWKIAEKRSLWRERKGGVRISLPHCKIRARIGSEGNPEVSITSRPRDDEAYMVIEEMMILAGEIAGKTGKDHRLPLPYRGQPQPEINMTALVDTPRGMCRSEFIKRRMRPAFVSSLPERHAALGLDAYVQVTSPIRRAMDLLAQRQLKAHLRGEKPPLSKNLLDKFCTRLGSLTRIRQKIETDSENYWAAEYFRQNMEKRKWKATLLGWRKQQTGHASVLIDELGLLWGMKVPNDSVLNSTMTIEVTAVDVKSGAVKFEVVK